MKLKKFLVSGMSAAMLLSFTLQAEASFNWGGIANKVANKAVDGIFSSGSKKTETKTEEQKASSTNKSQARTAKTKAADNGVTPTAFYGELDPLPPMDVTQRPEWFQKRRNVETMTNARLVAEYENLLKWQSQFRGKDDDDGDNVDVPDLLRRDEFYREITKRVANINDYVYYLEADAPEFWEECLASDYYKRGVASNIKPLYEYGLKEKLRVQCCRVIIPRETDS